MEIITKNEKETQEFAKNYAKKLKIGDILALIGDLGSGKTAFVKGVALGLGIEDVITSPTFVVMKEYNIDNFQFSIFNFQRKSKIQNPKLIHIDCYRINDANDAESIGLGEYLDARYNIVIIEWAENIMSILPKRSKLIRFENLGQNKRRIIIQ